VLEHLEDTLQDADPESDALPRAASTAGGQLKMYRPSGMPTLRENEAEQPLQDRESLSRFLRNKGFRLTPQREKILDIFYDLPHGEHLSAEELLERLREDASDISLATSYRTLKLLASLGVLRELDFAEQHKHYELLRSSETPHHHIICVHCGKMQEFESYEITQYCQQVAMAQGVQVLDIQLKIYGVCECRHASAQA